MQFSISEEGGKPQSSSDTKCHSKTGTLFSTPRTRVISDKSPVLYALILGVLIITVGASIPTFYDVLRYARSPWHMMLLFILEVSLVIFWLFGLYNIFVTLFGYLRPLDIPRVDYTHFEEKSVAIIYPTYNDFSAHHLEQSMNQTHDNMQVYIVDDSTDDEIRAEIDSFATSYEFVNVIRRQHRDGFKAGAMNNALKTHISEDFFVVMDSDEILPPDFIEQSFTYFSDERIGFVQANHDYNRTTATPFGSELGIGVDIHWDIYQRIRNQYGFVMLLGHGAIVKTDVWKEVGGFPEIVSEDLAFSTRLRMNGYYGVFAEDVTCLEDFPPDYTSFRKRHKKWTAGSIEYIRDKLPQYLLHSEPSKIEKLDVLIPTLQLPLTVVFIGYIIAVGLLEIGYNSVFPQEVVLPIHLGIITILTLLSPLYCYIIGLRHRLVKLLRFTAISTTVYTSVAVTAVMHGATILFGRKAVFLTTPKKTSSTVSLREYIPTLIFGFIGLAIAFKVGFLVGAVALAWILSPSIALFNNQTRLGTVSRGLCVLPALVLLIGVVLGLYTIFATPLFG